MNPRGQLFWFFLRFGGRISRAPFVLGFLLILVIQLFFLYRVATAVPGQFLNETLLRMMNGIPADENQRFWMEMFSFVGIATAFPMAAIHVKRLHDVGATGFLALFAFVPFLNLLAFAILGIMPGTAGPNRFGREPNVDG